MFGIGTTEILIILVVALIVIGPKKLPDVARTLGKALGEFKRMSSDVKRTIDLESERAEEKQRTKQAEKELFPEKADAGTSTASDATSASAKGASEKEASATDVDSSAEKTMSPDNKQSVAGKNMTDKEA
ncbi:MAG: Sec-independent protein translocase protein TatB [Desulfoplanes sp.]|nr:Sec-independent protein translocase protein TatB [Desulfoplanes sp.]